MLKQNNYSPLFAPLASLIAGIYTHTFILVPLWLSFTLLSISIVVSVVVWHKKHPMKAVGLIVFFFLAGICRATYLKQHQLTIKAKLFKYKKPLIATVQDIQRIQSKNMRYTLTLMLNQPTHTTITCYTKENLYLEIEDTIKITNVTLKQSDSIHLAKNPTFKHYLEKQGISATIFINDPKKIQLLSRPQQSINRWLHKLKNKVYWNLKRKLSYKTFSFVSIMFLGNKQICHQLQLRNKFNQWGLAHFLARSGLHIVLFIFLLAWLLRFLPIHLHVKYFMIFFICCTYYLLSWSSLSFIRAFLLYALIQQGRIWSLRPQASHVLNIISIAFLLINPTNVFFLDFQFTFGITFILLTIEV